MRNMESILPSWSGVLQLVEEEEEEEADKTTRREEKSTRITKAGPFKRPIRHASAVLFNRSVLHWPGGSPDCELPGDRFLPAGPGRRRQRP